MILQSAMGKRSSISSEDQTSLLVACRRRCCLCVFLRGDRREKAGQIAHIDQNSGNSSLENLVWLCLEHHDQYDSSTSQSKGLISGEVVVYRERLRGEIADADRRDAQSPVAKEPMPDNARQWLCEFVLAADSDAQRETLLAALAELLKREGPIPVAKPQSQGAQPPPGGESGPVGPKLPVQLSRDEAVEALRLTETGALAEFSIKAAAIEPIGAAPAPRWRRIVTLGLIPAVIALVAISMFVPHMIRRIRNNPPTPSQVAAELHVRAGESVPVDVNQYFDDSDKDVLRVKKVRVTSPSTEARQPPRSNDAGGRYGYFRVAADKKGLIYTAYGQPRSDSETYLCEVSDGYGGVADLELKVIIRSTENTGPKAEDVKAYCSPASAVEIRPKAHDADEEQLRITGVTQPGEAGVAEIVASTNRIRFVAAKGFSGVAQFTYTVADRHAKEAKATIRVFVPPRLPELKDVYPFADWTPGQPVSVEPIPHDLRDCFLIMPDIAPVPKASSPPPSSSLHGVIEQPHPWMLVYTSQATNREPVSFKFSVYDSFGDEPTRIGGARVEVTFK